jgi:hypothetical protein
MARSPWHKGSHAVVEATKVVIGKFWFVAAANGVPLDPKAPCRQSLTRQPGVIEV